MRARPRLEGFGAAALWAALLVDVSLPDPAGSVDARMLRPGR
jgi:hypothetical protein